MVVPKLSQLRSLTLIGSVILSLAEVDVPPEDLVFHKFYVNKMNSSKLKKKKKKKAAELLDVGDADEDADESDNEEMENMLDSGNVSFEADGEYDYNDLDQVANEEDYDLIGDANDVETDFLSDTAIDEDLEEIDNVDMSDDDGETINIGDGFDNTIDEYLEDIDNIDMSDDNGETINIGDGFDNKKRKRKSGGKVGSSPSACLEDYEHLLNEESPTDQKSMKKKKPKSRKKRKSSE